MSPVCSCRSGLSLLFADVMWVSDLLAHISPLSVLVFSLAVFPADGHDTCDASSIQRSH